VLRLSRRLFCGTILCVTATLLTAQAPAPTATVYTVPRIEVVSPSGARAGSEVEFTIALGTELADVEGLVFSHPGIKATVVVPEPPKVDPKADPKAPKKEVAKKDPAIPPKFKVTVAADVPLGNHDVRVLSKSGLSNPRAFVVGDLPEVAEKEPNNDVPEAQKVELNTTVNGTIAQPTDVDYFQFAAKKGQRVLAYCAASSIDSRLQPLVEIYSLAGRPLTQNRNYHDNDALADLVVPADGDYLIRLSQFTYLAGGPQYFYRLTVTTNPWIDAVFPPAIEAGKPTAVTLYGRNLPGGVADPAVKLQGAGLEKLAVTIAPPADPLAASRLDFRGLISPRIAAQNGFEYRLKGPQGSSNPVLVHLTSKPIRLGKEGIDTPEKAEEVPTPVELVGMIGRKLEQDFYAISAKKGDAIWFDLTSDRLGSDSWLNVQVLKFDLPPVPKAVPAPKDAVAPKEVAPKPPAPVRQVYLELNDDVPDNPGMNQFYARHSDPTPQKFVAPEDGKYLVRVSSRESSFRFGPTIAYRLRISPEQPDFRLVAMPESETAPDVATIRGDGNEAFDVYAFRQDDFKGPIALTVEGLPAGVTCPPNQIIGVGQKRGTLVLSAAANAPAFQGPVTIKGTAIINGQSVVREARPATITWGVAVGQNIPTISRVDRSLMLVVREKSPFRVNLEGEKAFLKAGEKLAQPIYIKQGEKLTVPYTVTRTADAKVPVLLAQVKTMANVQQMAFSVNNSQPLPPLAADKNEGTFVVDIRADARPGPQELVMKATATLQVDDLAKKAKKPLIMTTVSTPIRFTVVPSALGKITVTNPPAAIKAGMKGDLTIRVDRLNDHVGDYKIKFALPPTAVGVTVADAVIPAGQIEVKVPIAAAKDTPGGNFQNLPFTVTAMFEDRPIVAEGKFNIVVEKAPPEPKKKEEPKKKP